MRRATFLPVLVAVLPAMLSAQGLSVQPRLESTMFVSGNNLGAGDAIAYGGEVLFGISVLSGPRILFANGRTDAGNRPYNLMLAGASVRLPLVGKKTQLVANFSPVLMRFDLADVAGASRETQSIPAFGLDATLSVPLAYGLRFDIGAGDLITWAKQGALDGTVLPEAIRRPEHAPAAHIGVAFRWHRSDKVAKFEDMPVSFNNDFVPVRAGAVQTPELAVTQGLPHEHVAQGVEKELTEKPKTLSEVEERLLGRIYFGQGAYDVDPKFKAEMQNFANYLKANPEVEVRVKGFASSKGNVRQNLSLAEKRSAAVRRYLVFSFGIAEDRLEAVSAGVDEASSEALARRVEIWTIGVKEK